MEIANQMDEKLEGFHTLLARLGAVTQDLPHALQCLNGIAPRMFGSGLIRLAVFDIHVVPGGGIIPGRVTLNFVGPGADFGHGTAIEKFANGVAGMLAKARFGDVGDRPVPGLSPSGGGAGKHKKDQGRNCEHEEKPMHGERLLLYEEAEFSSCAGGVGLR